MGDLGPKEVGPYFQQGVIPAKLPPHFANGRVQAMFNFFHVDRALTPTLMQQVGEPVVKNDHLDQRLSMLINHLVAT